MYRTLSIIFLQIIIINILSGQTISIETEKDEYKLDEDFEITFTIDFTEDSVKLPAFEEIEVIGGPVTRKSVSINKGVTGQSKTWTYMLKPLKSGELKIESPVFYVNGKEITGNAKVIKISGSLLTTEEQRELRFREFIKAYNKPEGTLRYVLNEEFGYIEIFRNYKWELLRKLTKEEMELLRHIK